MDRSDFRFAVALLALTLALPIEHARAEDAPPARPRAAKSIEMLPALKSGTEGDRPRTAEQIRVNYITDRKLQLVQTRLNGKDFDGAYTLFEEVIADFRQAGLFDDRLNFTVQLWYAVIHEFRKKPDEAEAAYEQAIKLADRIYGVVSKEAAEPRLRWAFLGIRHKEQSIERTETAFGEALEIYRKLGDLNDVDYLNALQGVGICAVKRNRLPEAIAALREVCDRRRERYFDEFKTRGAVHHQLGVACVLARDFPAARASFDESAECYEKAQGPNGADVQEARDLSLKLAQATTRQGEVAQVELELKMLEKQYKDLFAAKNHRETLAISLRMEKILRAESDQLDEGALTISYRVADLQDQLGESEKAAAKFAEVLKLAERSTDCPPTLKADASYRLGGVELKLSRFAAAGRSLHRAEEEYAKLKPGKKRLWSIQQGLAAVEVGAKRYGVALDHADMMVALMDSENEASVRSTLVWRARIANYCHVDETQRKRCRAMLDAARADAVEAFGDQDLLLAEIVESVALVQYRECDPACMQTVEEALAIHGALLPAGDVELVGMEITLAKMCRAFGEVERARTMLEAIVAQLRNQEKPDDRLLSRALYCLAGIDAHQARKAEAEARYRESIALATRVYGADNEIVVKDRKTLDAYLAGTLPSLKPEDNPGVFNISVTVSP